MDEFAEKDRLRLRWLFEVGVVISLVASGCGSDDGPDLGQEAVAVSAAEGKEAVVTTSTAAAPSTSTDEVSETGDPDEDTQPGDDHEDHDHDDHDNDHDDHDHGGDGEQMEDAAFGEDCADRCAPQDDIDAIQRVVDAYNTGDWEQFTAAFGTAEPRWETGIGRAQPRHLRADLRWAAALEQTWTLGTCVDLDVSTSCELVVEDALHRALKNFGLEPSPCRLVAQVDGDEVDLTRYELSSCFLAYDSAFHDYGRWYEETYPDEPPIHGFHYRAWNQFDETAPARAAAHLDEYVENGFEGLSSGHH